MTRGASRAKCIQELTVPHIDRPPVTDSPFTISKHSSNGVRRILHYVSEVRHKEGVLLVALLGPVSTVTYRNPSRSGLSSLLFRSQRLSVHINSH